MAGGNAIRGTRVGAGPMGESERGETAPRAHISYFCASGHVTTPSFAAEAEIPDFWDCPRCGLPGGRDNENPPAAPRERISYFCSNGHVTTPSFASEAEIPEYWDCPRCGLPAGRDGDNPPAAPRTEPYKTHLAYVRERRNQEDGEAILQEALQKLRGKP